MLSQYRLLLQKSSSCHFARVTVEADMKESGIEVVEKLQAPVAEGDWDVGPNHFPEWIEVAKGGAQLCAETLVQQGKIEGCRVTVVRVEGSFMDTIAADVSCAAALATWQALCPDSPLPPIEFEGGQWHIHFD